MIRRIRYYFFCISTTFETLMFDFGLQNHICYSIGNVHLACASFSPVTRRMDPPNHLRGSSRPATQFHFSYNRPGKQPGRFAWWMPVLLRSDRFCLLQSTSLLQFDIACGDEGIRTPDLRHAKAALSQLSYIPVVSYPRVSGPFRART